MADINKIKLPSGAEYNIKDYRIPGVDTTPTSGSDNVVTSGGIHNSIKDFESFYFVQGSSSAAGNSTSGSYLSTKWEGTVPGVSTATNGLKIAYRIATNTGVSTAGVVLSIDGTNYYPVVIQKNTLVTTHYPVGTTVLMVFNSTQTASAYLTSNTKTTVTGCWQIMEYDSNTNTYQRLYVSSGNTEYPITTRYNTTTGESYYAEYGRYSEGVTLNPSTNTITASAFKVDEGTSSQVLKADGSLGTIDTTPTENSTNLVTSGGVYKALSDSDFVISTALNDLNTRLSNIEEIDEVPTENSTNPVSSGGVYDVIAENEEITSAALNNLNDRVVDLEDDVVTINDRIDSVQSNLYDINSAGTLNTTATTAQSTSSSEALSGDITLHKVAKTGTYSDLIGTPTIPDNVWKRGEGQARCVVVNSSKAGTTAGYDSFSEGYLCDTGGSATSNTKTANASNVVGSCSHAEGNATIARGLSCHSEGKLTFAWGEGSHAEGIKTHSGGHASHTEGEETKTNNVGEHAGGRYNSSTRTSSTYGNAGNTSFSHGIGTADNARKNALEIMENGDTYLYGVGSYDGTNYSVASTLQTVIGNIPAAVTESTVSGWGFTKNSGTLTGVSFNGTAATVTNGVAAITAPQILSGTADPASNLGNNGDIYLKLSS